MIFGGIHCLGWNYFFFQAHQELILWRVASVGMVCSPLMCVMFLPLVGTELNPRWVFELVMRALVLASWVISIFYLFSRITIFVLMFLSLRSLPPGAYDIVAWTKFIPHVTL
ncbi:hypothetical protein P692DRAFT_20752282 [Suillus brevipes Sb2]|nr:hypothetical protein P692DRAFT_20752282 [Suillus brevipes Sb2]